MADTLNVVSKNDQGLVGLVEATPAALGAAEVDHGHDAAEIVSGIIALERLPPTEGVVVASGNISTLTAPQQAAIVEGTLVVLGTGEQYRYKGSGSKTDLASYVLQVTSVGWSAITGKPDLEPALGNPGTGNWFLKTVSAVRSWVQLGALAFLDNVTDSQVASGAAIAWAKISKSGAAAADVGAIAAGAGAANKLAKWTDANSLGQSGLSDDGTNITATLPIGIDGAAGTNRTISFRTGSVLRWIVRATNVAEAGSDTGSPFEIIARKDDGSANGTIVYATRVATDPVYIGGALTDVTLRPVVNRTLAGTGTRAVAADSTGKLVIAASPSEPTYASGGISSANAVTLDSGTTRVTSIFLSEGIWDVEGVASVYVQFGQSLSAVSCDINAAGAVATNGSEVYAGQQAIPASSTVSITIPRRRIVAGVGSTEIFLAIKSTPSPVGPLGFGYITARKVF
jgi:hypothetical protein